MAPPGRHREKAPVRPTQEQVSEHVPQTSALPTGSPGLTGLQDTGPSQDLVPVDVPVTQLCTGEHPPKQTPKKHPEPLQNCLSKG